MQKINQFLGDETAATAIEYGLIAAGISIALLGIIKTLGSSMSTVFASLSTSIK